MTGASCLVRTRAGVAILLAEVTVAILLAGVGVAILLVEMEVPSP